MILSGQFRDYKAVSTLNYKIGEPLVHADTPHSFSVNPTTAETPSSGSTLRTKRGKVLRDTHAGPGLLVVDSVQHSFTLENMWRSDIPPRTGMVVDVTFAPDGALASVSAVSEAQVAKEQAQTVLSGALRHVGGLSETVMAHYGILNVILELLLLISFFALQSFSLQATPYLHPHWTGWEAIGVDLHGLEQSTTVSMDRGLLSVLAIACIFAPLAAPFLRQAWARWLYVAPLAFCLLALVAVWIEIHNAANEIAANMAGFGNHNAAMAAANEFSGAFSIRMGAYLVLLFSLAIATRMRSHS